MPFNLQPWFDQCLYMSINLVPPVLFVAGMGDSVFIGGKLLIPGPNSCVVLDEGIEKISFPLVILLLNMEERILGLL